jgi:hypothetical protein
MVARSSRGGAARAALRALARAVAAAVPGSKMAGRRPAVAKRVRAREPLLSASAVPHDPVTMAILSRTLIPMMGRRAARRFDSAWMDPERSQQRVLARILERNRGTEYGHRFGFPDIQTLAQWRARVPVVDYEDLRPWIDRVAGGEENVLTAEVPSMFARTSGTTGRPKLIPVTRTCRRRHADQIRTWCFHAWRDHPTIWSAKVLSLVSPAVEGWTASGIAYGSASGHVYRSLPRVARSAYAIPYEVFEIRDYESQYYVIMRIGIGEDVRFLASANPSSIVRLCETADASADAMLADLANGELRRDLDLPARTRALVEERLRPRPERARALEAARARRGGRLLPADYWPRLALVGCWKGGTVGGHLARFPEWFDPDRSRPVAVRDWGYLSSEARASIPMWDTASGGVLAVDANLYEFVKADEVDADERGRSRWTYLGVDDVEVGGEYYVFLTTTGGLYRYDIDDVLAVTGVHGRTPIVEFRRKGRGVTSLTGEKVSVTQVVAAFDAVSRALGIPVDHFKAEADENRLRYVFKVEASRGIPAPARARFLRALDDELSRQNLEYDARRKSQRLDAPVLHLMRPGWHDRQKKRAVDEGGRLFQAKTIKLSVAASGQDPDLVDVVTIDADRPRADPG